jgi:hypothetical protein
MGIPWCCAVPCVMRDRDEDVVGEFRTTDMRLGCLGEVWENQSERTRK